MKVDIWDIIRIVRNIAVVILIIMLIATGIVFWEPQVYTAAYTKIQCRTNQSINEIPQSRTIQNTSDKFSTFSEISLNKIKIKVPWTSMKLVKEEDNLKHYNFDNNKAIQVAYNEGTNLSEAFKKANSEAYNAMARIENPQVYDSNYEFTKYYLNASTKKLSLFSKKDKTNLDIALIGLKGFLAANIDKGIFTYENDKIKAIQYGQPNVGTNAIIIDIFEGNNKYRIYLPKSDTTWDEIDYILGSIEI